jgi:prepilin-type N-terminal cleavage/methylation domain-containing protein
MRNKKRAFTLIEVMVALAIMGLVLAGMFMYLRTNLVTYNRGQKKLSLQMELQRVMKFLYVELKRVGPIVYLDKKNNIVLDDEYNNDYKLSKLEFDSHLSKNGDTYVYRKVGFWRSDVFHLVRPEKVEIYYEKGKGLMKKVTDQHGKSRVALISPYVTGILFTVNKEDNKMLRISVYLKKGGKKDSFNLLIRLDTDFMGVF